MVRKGRKSLKQYFQGSAELALDHHQEKTKDDRKEAKYLVTAITTYLLLLVPKAMLVKAQVGSNCRVDTQRRCRERCF